MVTPWFSANNRQMKFEPSSGVNIVMVQQPTTADCIRPGDVGVTTPRNLIGLPTTQLQGYDIKAWTAFVARWDVCQPVPFMLCVKQNGPVGYLRVSTIQPDSRGIALYPIKADNIHIEIDLVLPTSAPDQHADRWIRAILRWFVLHELDECLLVEGDRKYDPHRPGMPPPTPENS